MSVWQQNIVRTRTNCGAQSVIFGLVLQVVLCEAFVHVVWTGFAEVINSGAPVLGIC